MIVGRGYRLRSVEIVTGTTLAVALLGIKAPTSWAAYVNEIRAFVGGTTSDDSIGFGFFLSDSALADGEAHADPEPAAPFAGEPSWTSLGGSIITAVGSDITQDSNLTNEKASLEGNIMTELEWLPADESSKIRIPPGEWGYLALNRAPGSTRNVVFRLGLELA